MPVNLTSYTGNADLGFGSNANLSPSANINLDAINNTARTIMLLDNDRNMKIFNQKIQDRDDLTRMIASDQVAIGDILPEYQPVFDDAKKKTEDAFFKWKGNFNDTKGFQEYKKARQNLADVATKAQANTVQIKKLEQEQSTKKLPRDQAEFDRHLKAQRAKGIWDEITPYQQMHDFSIANNLGGVNPFKRTFVDPNDPYTTVEETYVDYDDILRNKRNDFINDREKAQDQDTFYSKLQVLDQPQLVKMIDGMNSQLAMYNASRGLKPGQRGYAPPVETAMVDVDGEDKLVIQDSKPDFTAKFALANQPAFGGQSRKFNKELAKADNDRELTKLKARALGINELKARAYIRKVDADIKKQNQKAVAEGTSINNMLNAFVDNLGFSGLNITPTKAGGPSGKRDIVDMRNLPKGFQFINGVVIDSKGKVNVGKLEPFISNDEKAPYYITEYQHPATGEKFTLDKLPSDMSGAFDRAKQRVPGYTKELFIKDLMKAGKLEVLLKGQNGTANFTSMKQSAQLLNAAATTKGEENVINAEEPVNYEITTETSENE